MLIPVCCFTCGKVIGDSYLYYVQKVREKKLALKLDATKPSILEISAGDLQKTPEGEVMDDLGFTRYCCRKVLLTHIELINDI
jgi:hypothetical protein